VLFFIGPLVVIRFTVMYYIKPANPDFAPNCFCIEAMPKKSNPQEAGSEKETLGQRLARIRKEGGFTQQQLAERTGLIQVLISDYERGKLRLTAEMAIRFVDVLGVGTDELLRGKKRATPPSRQPSLKLLRRMEQIEKLPQHRQRALLAAIDFFLRNPQVDKLEPMSGISADRPRTEPGRTRDRRGVLR
jgi:transcriptional regulator with XRE-family HTH domain